MHKSSPGFIVINGSRLNTINPQNRQIEIEKIRSWLDDNGNLKKSAMLLWIHQLLDLEFMNLKKPAKSTFILSHNGNEYILKRKRSGPAHTLIVEVANSTLKTKTFSIDLVVALNLDAKHWKSDIEFDETYWTDKWHAIPKPDQSGVHEGDCQWITSYADIERIFIKDRSKLKVLIRIFKVINYNLFLLFTTLFALTNFAYRNFVTLGN